MKNVILCLCSLLLITACAGNREYARMIPDLGVQNDYKNFIIPEGYTYYYAGVPHTPSAIVGIRDSYEMRSKYWHKFNLTESGMAALWPNIRDEWFSFGLRSRELGGVSNGYRIMTKDGEEVGRLFSQYRRVVATFPEPGVVTLSVPMDVQWEYDVKD